ncbi:MAG TPA: insulinase family protein, partial [Polyangiaceae bacterium]
MPIGYEIGSVHRGFRVKRTAEVELMRSLAVELEHEASGARVLHVKNDDSENLFSITFPTVPPDDTGVPHILEHSVLAGSRRYPHKDSFMELYRSSAATFINAMTAGDHTLYPVSSTVPRDLFILADVYFDAVFHPLLSEHTFRREGHRLELVTKGDGKRELSIKGIVYSEMRGAYSDAESLLHRERDRALFPDTLYGRDSGGDPAVIPELDYQSFRAFYQRYYHPSNALFVLYGNIPTEDYLE